MLHDYGINMVIVIRLDVGECDILIILGNRALYIYLYIYRYVRDAFRANWLVRPAANFGDWVG
jgi:hypothetical protein